MESDIEYSVSIRNDVGGAYLPFAVCLGEFRSEGFEELVVELCRCVAVAPAYLHRVANIVHDVAYSERYGVYTLLGHMERRSNEPVVALYGCTLLVAHRTISAHAVAPPCVLVVIAVDDGEQCQSGVALEYVVPVWLYRCSGNKRRCISPTALHATAHGAYGVYVV